MSPAPPSLIRHSPSRTRPAPYAESTWSAPPTTMAVPAARPVARGGAATDLSHDRSRRTHLEQRGPAHVGGVLDGRDRCGVEVVQATFDRPVFFDVVARTQGVGEPVVRAADRGNLLPDLGLVKIEPARRGCHRLLRENRPGESQEIEVTEGRANLVNLTRRARVVLQNRSAQWPVLLIEEHHRGHHARNRQGRDVGSSRAHVAQQQRNERRDTRPPFLGLGFRPPGVIAVESDVVGAARHDAAIRVQQDGLHPRRSEVDAEKE